MKFLLALMLSAGVTSSIFSISLSGADGSIINLNSYQGKKILIVNIATGSERAGQLGVLQQMQQQYGDSLVVIGFPSNSFGNEPRTNSEIIQFCQATYGVSFPIAAKGDVKGSGINALYHWLTLQAENGVMNQEVKGDFQKYLINGDGEIIAVFSGSAEANHPGLIQAIEN